VFAVPKSIANSCVKKLNIPMWIAPNRAYLWLLAKVLIIKGLINMPTNNLPYLFYILMHSKSTTYQ
jgi:hypothetical protein